MNIIEIYDLTYKNLFKNFNFSIKNNTFLTLSGCNNCGKTTLLRILNREIITYATIFVDNISINDYTIYDYSKKIQCVIPLEIVFQERCLIEELYLYNNSSKEIDKIIKKLKLKGIMKESFENLNTKEIILSQIAVSLIIKPKVLLLDCISSFFEEKETLEILETLKDIKEEFDMTIIYTTVNLKESICSDYIYIIDNKEISLEGTPVEVLQKDNIINKIGLNVPFMIDLSVKLKDYDLIDNIELDLEGMIDKLWK